MDCVTIAGFERQIVWPTNATVVAEYCLKSERGIEQKHDNCRKNGYRYEEH
jgi:hypothetical protein